MGPGCVGLVLGWGAVPVVWLLTREARAGSAQDWMEPHRDPGLTASEPIAEESGWPACYFALRQRLVLSSLLAFVPLPALALLLLSTCLPTVVSLFEGTSLELPLSTRILIFLTRFLRTPLGASLLWSFLALWPVALAWLLQSSYRVPILGRVWRCCDRIWSLSKLPIPSEARFRGAPRNCDASLESERAALEQAVASPASFDA